MIADPSHPDYNAAARDAIMDLCPFYDPHHKCGIVREKVFKEYLTELRDRNRVTLDATNNALPGWIAISDQLPNVGDVIACAAEHYEGGMMFWAGTVTELWEQGFAVMETRREKTRSFVITDDTLWMLLPPLPNDNPPLT